MPRQKGALNKATLAKLAELGISPAQYLADKTVLKKATKQVVQPKARTVRLPEIPDEIEEPQDIATELAVDSRDYKTAFEDLQRILERLVANVKHRTDDEDFNEVKTEDLAEAEELLAQYNGYTDETLEE